MTEPTAHDTRAAVVAPADWAGLPHQRPGLFRRKDAAPVIQVVEPEDGGEGGGGIAEPPGTGRVLATKDLTLTQAAELCGGAKGALGVTKGHPNGQLGPDWVWRATWGLGVRTADGRLTESLALRLARGDRSALFLWTRQAAPVVLLLALDRALYRWYFGVSVTWPVACAVLRALPAPDWKSVLVTTWDRDPVTGHLTDIPRPVPSSTVKKEIRT